VSAIVGETVPVEWSIISWIVSFNPTPTPSFQGGESVGVNSGLFYGLLLLGAILFLAAYIYGRRQGPS
jgi:hypothetical protein